jgi:serine/threonine protein phosphatase PrpC
VVALRAGSATDVGRVRSNNQDSLLLADPLYAVADGMGGAAAGEVASSLAVEALGNGFARSGGPTVDNLVSSARAANRAVWDEAEANPEMRGMGTTLVAIALVQPDSDSDSDSDEPQLAIINIGDSRLYVLHDDELRQVTFDHNLVAELVAEGRITPAEAEVHPRRNIMTRALGVEPEVSVDLFVEAPVLGDRYLLCSDGLPREINDDGIASLLRRYQDPDDAARELVEEAKRRGGNDNITVVIVDVVADDDPALAAAAAPAGADLDQHDPDRTRRTPLVASAADGDLTQAVPVATAAVIADQEPAREPTRSREPTPSRAARSARMAHRIVTVRVVMFLLLLAIIVIGAIAAIVWYARDSYFVGLRHNADGSSEIVIFQGRPGGVLGLNPTIKEDTGHTTNDVLASEVPTLQAGQEVSSLDAANTFVNDMVQAKLSTETTTTTTTLLPTTTSTAHRATTTTKP